QALHVCLAVKTLDAVPALGHQPIAGAMSVGLLGVTVRLAHAVAVRLAVAAVRFSVAHLGLVPFSENGIPQLLRTLSTLHLLGEQPVRTRPGRTLPRGSCLH